MPEQRFFLPGILFMQHKSNKRSKIAPYSHHIDSVYTYNLILLGRQDNMLNIMNLCFKKMVSIERSLGLACPLSLPRGQDQT